MPTTKELDYHILFTEEEFETLLKELESAPVIALDLETSGLDYRADHIVGWSLSTHAYSGYYIPVAHLHPDEIPNQKFRLKLYPDPEYAAKCADFVQLDPLYVAERLKPILERPDVLILIHNLKFDTRFIRNIPIPHDPALSGDPEFDPDFLPLIGIHPYKMNVHDTILELMIGGEGEFERFALKPVMESKFGVHVTEYDELFPPHTQKKNRKIEYIDPWRAGQYACGDGDYLHRIHDVYGAKCSKGNLYTLEHKLLHTFQEIEDNGITGDTQYMQTVSEYLEIEAEKVKAIVDAQLEALAGQPLIVDLNSPKQLREALFEVLKIPIPGRYTKTGLPATDEIALTLLAAEYPLASNVLAYRSIKSTATNLGETLFDAVAPDGRIHTHYNQWTAWTGRSSATSPNLQNVAKNKTWKIYNIDGSIYTITINPRNVLRAAKGYYLLEFDFSAIEFAVMAQLAGEMEVVKTYEDGIIDVHEQTASDLFSILLESVTEEERSLAKTCNYMIIYGGSGKRLADQTGLPRDEADAKVQRFFQVRPNFKSAIDAWCQFARQNGYIKTFLGRKLRIREYALRTRAAMARGDRQTTSGKIQGSAAEYHKLSILRARNEIRKKYPRKLAKTLLQTHDSQCWEVHLSIPPQEIVPLLKKAMSFRLDGLPKIRVDTKIGITYGAIEKYKEQTDYAIRLQELYEESLHLETALTVPVETVAAPPKSLTLILDPGETLTTEKVEELRSLLLYFPGENLVYLKKSSGELIPLEKYKTNMNRNSLLELLQGVFPHCSLQADLDAVVDLVALGV